MENIDKYRILTIGKSFFERVKTAVLLLKEEEVYELLKEEASVVIIPTEGVPSAIFERAVQELLSLKCWYVPDEIKIWDRRFGSLFKSKYFCYDDDVETWSGILHKYFEECDYMPKREDYGSTRSFNRDWGYFAELLAVAKENKHPDFNRYCEIAVRNGMGRVLLERKSEELAEIKKMFVRS